MDKLFIQVLNLSIAGSWMILAVLLLRLILKRAPKAIVCALWLLVGLRLLLPVSIESALSLIPSRQTVNAAIVEPGTLPPVRMSSGIQTSSGESGGSDLPSQVEVIDSGLPALDRALNPVINESLAPEMGDSVDPLQLLTAASGWIWLLGCLGMLGYGAFSFLRLKLRLRESVLVEAGIREGAMVGTPFVLGIFRPVIYLPLGLSERDTEMVLSHERAHLKRRDNWTKPLAFILLAVHWFNPLMWISYVLLCRDIESACDERVLRDMGREERRAYSAALLNCSVRPRMIGACPLAFGELSVKGRIKSVLNYKKPGFWISLAALAACAVVAVCFLTDPVKEPEEAQPSPEPLAAEDEGEAQPQESLAPEETMPSVDSSLLFVIPKDGDGSDYAPENLTQIREETEELPALYMDSRAAESMERMLSDCRSAGHEVAVFRAYESYEETLEEIAESFSGEPQLSGSWDVYRSATKLDLQSSLSAILARLPDGGIYTPQEQQDQELMEQLRAGWFETRDWLEEHCGEYGFILRFPGDKTDITGRSNSRLYHYVGETTAEYMKEQNMCLEEYVMAAGGFGERNWEAQNAVTAEVLGAYEVSGEYLCYVNLSPMELEDLRPESNILSIMGERALGENGLSYIRASYRRDYQVKSYDEQSKTLTVCFREFMDKMGDEWPVEVDVKMLLNGESLPGPGKLLLPEPQQTERLSLSFSEPVEYSREGMDNPLYLLGVELEPCALGGVMSWADYERFREDGQNADKLSEAEAEWLYQTNTLFTQSTSIAVSRIIVYMDDGSRLEISASEAGLAEEDGKFIKWSNPFPRPIDLDRVTAVSVDGQTIEVG